MPKSATVAFRLTAEQKALLSSVCHQKGITESAFIRQVMGMAVETAGDIPLVPSQSTERVCRSCRVSVRLRPDDGLLVWERAGKHRLSMSAYAARIVGDHVQARLPLPTAELEALKASIDEVNAIGRRLNDMSRALNQGEHVSGPSTADLKTLLAAMVALRDRCKALITANASSWGL